uniref:Granulocyte-macrophage colony-stimulating factor receptor subunit alpha-like n=1 Tax=Bos indicus x Bos taurus TaxID=30522 RepID=A0A4W2HKF8_BOBOX
MINAGWSLSDDEGSADKRLFLQLLTWGGAIKDRRRERARGEDQTQALCHTCPPNPTSEGNWGPPPTQGTCYQGVQECPPATYPGRAGQWLQGAPDSDSWGRTIQKADGPVQLQICSMVVLLDFVILLVLLNSARSTVLAGEKESPIVNLTLDSRKKILSWNSRRIVTQQTCAIVTPLDPDTSQEPQVRNDTYFCTFPNAVLHRGATLTVNATSEGQDFSHQLAFSNPGKEGSGAQDLSCIIYNVRLMNCSWTRGPAAPADVQYQLYSWTSLHGNVSECSHYVLDSAGTRVGCHFDELGEGHTTDDYFFLVNGTSSDSDIQFLDSPSVNGPSLEKYNPPANVTVQDNVSHFVIRWDAPAMRYSLSNSVLRYALDIQKMGSFSKREPVFLSRQYKNKYRLPRADVTGEHTVRMRVQHVLFQIWSEWSSTHHFGVPEENFLVVLIGLVVGATVLFGMALMFLCKRFSLKKKLFPPIPRVKQELAGAFLASLEETASCGGHPPSASQDPEDIFTVEETLSLASAPAKMGGPAPAPNPYENIPSAGPLLNH